MQLPDSQIGCRPYAHPMDSPISRAKSMHVATIERCLQANIVPTTRRAGIPAHRNKWGPDVPIPLDISILSAGVHLVVPHYPFTPPPTAAGSLSSATTMSQITYFALASTFISLIVVFYVRSIAQRRARTLGRPLPPGPKTLPILGNMFNMPRVRPWIVYRDLSHVLGDIIHLHVLGQHIVVLGSAQAIYEYLDKRSANTSDRVQSPMIELSGASFNLAFMPYGQRWRRHRRSLWQYFHREATEGYKTTQQSAAHIFLQELCERPSDLRDIIRLNFASVIMKIGYDIAVQSKDDAYLKIAKDAHEGRAEGMVPGRFLVDFLPFLRHIPPFFPFAASQKLWVKWKAAGDRLKNTPFECAKAKLARGQPTQSIVANSLVRLGKMGISSPEEEEIVKNVGAVAFEAGIDTVLSTMLSVFSGVSLHPEVLAKAHAELDEVVGPHRLPDFSDKDSLVYINAIIKEAMRWHTVLPMGVPHATVADDEFRGYFIPAGTMVLPNTWACMHDPEVYEDPDVFRPERFIRNGKLDPTVQDPTAFSFGYGRRICPGRYFADSALFINVACAIHVFDVTPPLGEDGLPIEVKQGHTDGFISHPEDVRCTIKPRSATAEALLRSHATSARQSSNEGEQVTPDC